MIGAINQIDEGYVATVVGCESGGGFCRIELVTQDTGETIEHYFNFSVNIWEAGPRITEDSRTGKDTSDIFGQLVGLEADHILGVAMYGHRGLEEKIDFHIDERLILGKEIGIAVGNPYGKGRRVMGFYPVSELSTLAVVD